MLNIMQIQSSSLAALRTLATTTKLVVFTALTASLLTSSMPVTALDTVTVHLGCLRPSASYIKDPSLVLIEKGLWLCKAQDEYRAIAILDGKQIVAASAEDEKTLRTNIQELVRQKAAQIQSTFGVEITLDGQPFCTQEGAVIETRTPYLAELLSLEFALSKANPSFMPRKKNSTPLRFCFLTQPNCIHAVAEWLLDANKKPVIAVEPTESKMSLESVFLHELSHHSQYRMGLDPTQFGSWKKAREVGWQFFQNPTTGENGWAVRTKANELFKFAARLNSWVKCNSMGQPLGTDGQRVKRHYDAQRLAPIEIRMSAMIRPATNYFTNPAEVMAEGMMLFRLNADTHNYLKAVSPELYDLVKAEDQEELDRAYGAGTKIRLADGHIVDGNKIRMADGHIVDGTQNVRLGRR